MIHDGVMYAHYLTVGYTRRCVVVYNCNDPRGGGRKRTAGTYAERRDGVKLLHILLLQEYRGPSKNIAVMNNFEVLLVTSP